MRALVPALLVLALAIPVDAHHCATWSTTEGVAGGVLVHAGDVYLLLGREGPCDPECQPTFWVYEESNGIEGLQRADEAVDDTCHGMILGDTVRL